MNQGANAISGVAETKLIGRGLVWMDHKRDVLGRIALTFVSA